MSTRQDFSVRYLKGVGPKKAETFAKAGIKTIEDLLYYFPRRYEDRTSFAPISKLTEGQNYTIRAKILAKGQRRSWHKYRFSILEVAVGDDTGKIFCVWFNQPYLKNYFEIGKEVILYGKVEHYKGRLQINSPEFELIPENESQELDIGKIIPVYSLPERTSQRYMRKIIRLVLEQHLPKINDFIPYDIRSRHNILNLAKSLINIHFPENNQMQLAAYQRLAFEEFFLFQIPIALRKLKKKEKQGIAHIEDTKLAREFINNLPFELTKAQYNCIWEIKTDMSSKNIMQRLLQGDVGSGKTVVATTTALFAIEGGYQATLMAPTEILAKQHYEKISSQLSKLANKKIATTLLVSGLTKKEKENNYLQIKEGKIDFIVGTHALLEENVEFKKLGLVIIDEQHKFGVGQRALLPKKGVNPDVLIMTATPIPRTLAITLYGDLDISVINQLPPGRKQIKTMHFKEEERDNSYLIAKEHLLKGQQAYIIYPVIDNSYALDIAGAKMMYEELKAGAFADFKVGLIHGRLKQAQQDRIMSDFKNGLINVLVATTILEVGIDVTNATCMIIEQAQRFGLSQLHQLRGRIGRGNQESICLLISDAKTAQAQARLDAMVKYADGFRIAEEDLKIRGPGEFFGSRQHGLTELKIANPLTQMRLLKLAREEAIQLANTDPRLKEHQNILLKDKLLQRFPEYEKFVTTG